MICVALEMFCVSHDHWMEQSEGMWSGIPTSYGMSYYGTEMSVMNVFARILDGGGMKVKADN